jgi:acyl-CoA synthetase (AMP-forming)/AMP-acid ligase II
VCRRSQRQQRAEPRRQADEEVELPPAELDPAAAPREQHTYRVAERVHRHASPSRGRTDPVTGQAIVAFVTMKGGETGSPEQLAVLRDHVAKVIGPIARPANIVFTNELPKTRSGKIMRRLLRDVAENRPLGDTTTLADPAIVEEIKELAVTEAGRE